jgi:hypothetical protein
MEIMKDDSLSKIVLDRRNIGCPLSTSGLLKHNTLFRCYNERPDHIVVLGVSESDWQPLPSNFDRRPPL